MKKTVFIKNAAIMTVSSLILRFVGIIFKVWLAAGIGSEGVGLYQLVFSVYVLASTFATSGICTAVTRLAADELALGSRKGTVKILKRSIELTLLIAFLSVALIYFGAPLIASRFLGDMRAVPAMKILSFSLPFMGVSSCLRGYFIARRKASPGSLTQIAEQGIRILLVVLLVKKYMPYGLAYCCGAVLAGDTVAEAAACTILAIVYFRDKRSLNGLSGRTRPPYAIVKQILHISVPITAGRYLNTALRTAENVLVPKCLSKCPRSGENALSQFGMIKGMALPILFFPSTLLNSLSTLLIPEMSEASACGRRGLVKSAAENILKLTALMSYIFAAVFFVAGEDIGILIYNSRQVGYLLRALSPIVPLMYLDSVSDGILKGLDQQTFTFRTAVCDSSLRIILILLALPKYGLDGFIGIMYFSNLLTCVMNVGRLLKVSGAEFKIVGNIVLPLFSALAVVLTFNSVTANLFALPILVYIILLCAVCIPVYIMLLFLFGCISKDDILNVIK